MYLSIHVLLALMKNIRNIYNNKIMAKLLRDIREKLFCKVLSFKMKTYNQYNSSEIYTRLTADTDNLFSLFFGILDILVNNVVYIVLMIVMMFSANINLAIIGCATIAVIGVSSFKFTKKLKDLDNKVLGKRDEENKEFSEIYNKNKLTYLFQLQKKNTKRTNQLLEEELRYRRKYIFVHTFMYPATLLLEAIRNICYFVLCIKYKLEYLIRKHLFSSILRKTV